MEPGSGLWLSRSISKCPVPVPVGWCLTQAPQRTGNQESGELCVPEQALRGSCETNTESDQLAASCGVFFTLGSLAVKCLSPDHSHPSPPPPRFHLLGVRELAWPPVSPLPGVCLGDSHRGQKHIALQGAHGEGALSCGVSVTAHGF